uniref:Cysteine-rich repeat secretory protein 12-like n=1 Tax=Tanacetum cinerariifolium TaxID=118510 RepID=A0A6L2LFV8_TANCI|nr:cysteine-rich repeat secretory protein 12-like [Tanacetum cinerariifolium]
MSCLINHNAYVAAAVAVMNFDSQDDNATRKDMESNGVFHENEPRPRPNKMARHISNLSPENGRRINFPQSPSSSLLDKQGASQGASPNSVKPPVSPFNHLPSKPSLIKSPHVITNHVTGQSPPVSTMKPQPNHIASRLSSPKPPPSIPNPICQTPPRSSTSPPVPRPKPPAVVVKKVAEAAALTPTLFNKVAAVAAPPSTLFNKVTAPPPALANKVAAPPPPPVVVNKVAAPLPPAVTNKAAAPSLSVPKKKPPVPVKPPPHPDTKYLSQILSVPKPDQLCGDDDLEWLFNCKEEYYAGSSFSFLSVDFVTAVAVSMYLVTSVMLVGVLVMINKVATAAAPPPTLFNKVAAAAAAPPSTLINKVTAPPPPPALANKVAAPPPPPVIVNKVAAPLPPSVTNKVATPSLSVPKKKPPVPVKPPVKPPHSDTKYQSQILSVPKPDQLCGYDDLEWLFNRKECKKPPAEGPQVQGFVLILGSVKPPPNMGFSLDGKIVVRFYLGFYGLDLQKNRCSILSRILWIGSTKVSAQNSIIYVQCSQSCFTSMSPFESNVNSLFTSLVNSATVYNFNKFAISPPGYSQNDSVYGLFQCRGDLSSSDCKECVMSSITQLRATCPVSTGGAIQLDGCFVKYDKSLFFGDEDQGEVLKRCGPSVGYNSDALNLIDSALGYLIAGNGLYFRAGDYGRIQGVAQCVQDLSESDCQDCISEACGRLRSECQTSTWGDMYLGKCFIRYVDQVFDAGNDDPSDNGSSGSAGGISSLGVAWSLNMNWWNSYNVWNPTAKKQFEEVKKEIDVNKKEIEGYKKSLDTTNNTVAEIRHDVEDTRELFALYHEAMPGAFYKRPNCHHGCIGHCHHLLAIF